MGNIVLLLYILYIIIHGLFAYTGKKRIAFFETLVNLCSGVIRIYRQQTLNRLFIRIQSTRISRTRTVPALKEFSNFHFGKTPNSTNRKFQLFCYLGPAQAKATKVGYLMPMNILFFDLFCIHFL